MWMLNIKGPNTDPCGIPLGSGSVLVILLVLVLVLVLDI